MPKSRKMSMWMEQFLIKLITICFNGFHTQWLRPIHPVILPEDVHSDHFAVLLDLEKIDNGKVLFMKISVIFTIFGTLVLCAFCVSSKVGNELEAQHEQLIDKNRELTRQFDALGSQYQFQGLSFKQDGYLLEKEITKKDLGYYVLPREEIYYVPLLPDPRLVEEQGTQKSFSRGGGKVPFSKGKLLRKGA